MDIIAFAVFSVVQILFIPLAVIGLLLMVYKQVYVSNKLGVASNAVEVLNGRWAMHVFGLRKDEVSARLARALPNNSLIGMWLILFPSYLRYKISGKTYGYPVIPPQEEEGLSHLITARTVYFDRIINKHINDIEQLIIMGAGFDTRCYGPFKQKVTCFELDKPAIQRLKVLSLEAAGIDASQVRFVAVDFSSGQWGDKLVQAGYEVSKPTLFLWEGVTLYLDELSVRNTLREICRLSLPGSILVCDIYASRIVKGDYAPGIKKSQQVLKFTGEEFGFGLDLTVDAKNILAEFMAREGLELKENYLMGKKTKRGVYMSVLEAVVDGLKRP